MDRFWSKAAPHPSGCLLWGAAKNAKGYGRFGLNGRNRYAHNVAYELTCGSIPDGLVVMHECDVRACINPKHLRLGTHAENCADMIRKGRDRRVKVERERNGQAKLDGPKVAFIRSSSLALKELAEMFGVEKSTIGYVRRGDTWR